VPAAGTADVNKALTGGATYQGMPVVIYANTQAGTSGNIVIGTIPQTYRTLELYVSARGIGTVTAQYENLRITINAVGTLYDFTQLYTSAGSVAVAYTTNTTSWLAGHVPTGTVNAGQWGDNQIVFQDYSHAVKFPHFMSKSSTYVGTAPFFEQFSGVCRSSGAIATITLALAGGSAIFAGSTSYTLIGIP
jgi:hypothetical protein